MNSPLKDDQMEKGAYIKDIVPGTRVRGIFCVATSNLRSTRAGVPYLAFSLMDRTGNMEARIWEDAERISRLFSPGDYVIVEADAQEFNGKCQMKVNSLEPVNQDGDVDAAMFLPSAPIDREAAWQGCEKAIKSVKNPEFALILREIFSNRKIREDFCQAPAAKKMHHACIGGLLQHSMNLLRLSEAVCSLYPHLDRDLMITASICHDLGKIREFSWCRPPIDYTDEGRLLGHIVIGLQLIEKVMEDARLKGDSRNVLALKHVIVSHHGQKEFGSPVLPMTEEAVVFHMIDDLDAKLEFLDGLKKEGEGPGWTDFQRLFERFFFLGPRVSRPSSVDSPTPGTEEDSGERPETGDGSRPSQARLWDGLNRLDSKD